MIDRIEELLGSLAAGDEEEQESGLAQKRGDVVSSGLSSERSESREAPEGRTAFAVSESLGRVANRRSVTTEKRGDVVSSGLSSERSESGEAPEDRTAFAVSESLGRVANRRSVTTGEIAPERSEPIAGELWKDGPVWTVRGAGPEADEARRMAAVERTARTEEVLQPPRDGDPVWVGLERAARGGAAGLTLEGVGRSTGLEQTGLKGLYRQTVRGLQPAAPALPPEQSGRTARAQESGSAASLAVDELDRAVRRDSRRYDGGMNIY